MEGATFVLRITPTQFLHGHARGVVFVNKETNNACKPKVQYVVAALEKK